MIRIERIRVIGLDPGLRHLGFGIVDLVGSKLCHVAHGALTTDSSVDMPGRLKHLFRGLSEIIEAFNPDEVAVETTFVNKDASASLKLGQARAIALLAPALRDLSVAEYAPNHIKKAVVGAGHADKAQIHHMVKRLLPGIEIATGDAADALAIAICHAHHLGSRGAELRLARARA
jgi:crossover junction endodeoxyribonuclease RuvC